MKHLPNILTITRLGLAAVMFYLITRGDTLSLDLAFLFLVMAFITDVLDGYIARTWRGTSDFGRTADPIADKVLICCGFIFLQGLVPDVVTSWMVAVIVARELVVTMLRGYIESRQVPFAATFLGKFKMAGQSAVMGAVILLQAHAPRVSALRTTVFWLMVTVTLITAASGVIYLVRARKLLGEADR